ncbi:MAG: phosphoglycerate dehydrogenase [Candidatus Melainabacteria bacterium GWF2_37_15]|nr:MAG: phosphoglycerate dehydrogenase [Candidatus Melainabacteria bacterium GWF2_37_15]
MKPRVLITDKINQVAGDILSEVADVDFKDILPEDELCKIIGEYDGMMVRSQTTVTPKMIEAARNMKIIGRAGVGVDNINLEAATNKGIIVVNSPEGNTAAAAEHTVALILSMARNIPQADASLKQGKWERSKFTGVEVFNKTLGTIGLGKIGSRVVKAAVAMDMKVIVYDPYVTQDKVEELGATLVKSLDEFWGVCDFITIHVPKTRETAYLINKDTLNKMKKGVMMVNCARGGIVDEEALKEALESGHVAAAALDVFEKEPIDPNSPLLTANGRIVMTPHLGASTEEAQIKVAVDVAEQIRDVLAGKSAKSAVNIPYLRPELLEPVKEYMNLAENIGLLARQISEGGIKQVEITLKGKLSQYDTTPLKVAVLKGILSHNLEDVNYVNTPVIVKQQGFEVIESKSEQSGNYDGLIRVKITTDVGSHQVSGAMIADKTPRIVTIDNYTISLEIAEHILVTPHQDKPGMIAKVSTILGNNNINIRMMMVARKENTVGGESTMIITTDEHIWDEILDEIKQVQGIYDAKYISLKPDKTAQAALLPA